LKNNQTNFVLSITLAALFENIQIRLKASFESKPLVKDNGIFRINILIFLNSYYKIKFICFNIL
jgi:hypothetical protein